MHGGQSTNQAANACRQSLDTKEVEFLSGGVNRPDETEHNRAHEPEEHNQHRPLNLRGETLGGRRKNPWPIDVRKNQQAYRCQEKTDPKQGKNRRADQLILPALASLGGLLRKRI